MDDLKRLFPRWISESMLKACDVSTSDQGWKETRFLNLSKFFTKTDVVKHKSVSQKHLKSASHRTHTVVYTVCCFPFHGLQHTKDKITPLLLLGVKYNK